MTQQPDKLMSRDSVKTFILANKKRFGSETAVNLARQLYDTMGEIEFLKSQIEKMTDEEMRLTRALQRYRDSSASIGK